MLYGFNYITFAFSRKSEITNSKCYTKLYIPWTVNKNGSGSAGGDL